MKSLVDYIEQSSKFLSLDKHINEANESAIDSGMVEAYFNDIHDGLKRAVNGAIGNTNEIVYEIWSLVGEDSVDFIFNKSQVYDSIIEGLLFKVLNNLTDFVYKTGKENTTDRTFICTKTAFSDKVMQKMGTKTFSIQLKTSKNSATFTTTIDGTTEPSFFILISYKKDGYKISLDKAYFGYLTPEDWTVSSNNAKLNTKSFVKKSDKMLFEI